MIVAAFFFFFSLVEGSPAGYHKACPLSLTRKLQIYPDLQIVRIQSYGGFFSPSLPPSLRESL